MAGATVEIAVGWDVFFGVFGGTLAGIVTTAVVHHFNMWLGKRKRLRNAILEVGVIIKRIEIWLKYIESLKTAIVSSTLESTPCYFDFSKIAYPTIASMFTSGELYGYLDDERIYALQEAAARFTINWENGINSDVAAMKAMEIAEAVNKAKFWEQMLTDHRKDLQAVLGQLKRKQAKTS